MSTRTKYKYRTNKNQTEMSHGKRCNTLQISTKKSVKLHLDIELIGCEKSCRTNDTHSYTEYSAMILMITLIIIIIIVDPSL